MARRPYFSGNYGSALGSTANAANLIAQAGAVQGQMFANLGKIAAESINKYTENKQKKEEEKQAASFIENYLKDKPEMAAQFGIKSSDLVSFEEAVKQGSSAIAKNPKGMETVKGLITMEQQRVQAQQTADFNRLREDLLRSEQERVNQQQKSQAKFNQFLTQPGPSQVDPSGPDRNSVLRNMRAGKGATPPARMVPGPSPAEQMLASPEAKSFMQRAIQQGAPVQQSMMMASQVDAAKQPRPMNELEVYEGKKIIDQAYQPPSAQKDMSGPTIVNDSVGIAMDLIGPFTTGFGSYLKVLPESDALSLDKTLETIKANIGFDKLQAMREASPTGGALGQVSNQELSSLQSVFGSLDQSQSDEDLKYNLQRLQHIYNNIIHGVGEHPYQMPTRGGTSKTSGGNTTATRGQDGVIRFK
jgi:hypothetical protein